MIPPRFAVIDISYEITDTGVIIKATTDVPCHLWLRRTSTKPRIHLDPVLKRGLATHAEPRFCFVVPEDDEQDEPGDTPEHTFPQPDWPVCVTRYHYFWGKIAGNDSPSESAIFKFHRTEPPPSVDFYPDAYPGLTTVDGSIMTERHKLRFEDMRNFPFGTERDSDQHGVAAFIQAHISVNWWYAMSRSIFLFDTSSIPIGVTILSATLTLYGHSKRNRFSYPEWEINVFASNPATNTSLTWNDYSALSSTPLSDNPILIDDWAFHSTEPRPNDFILNAAGLAAITQGGITKLGTRNSNYDAPNIAPVWESDRPTCGFYCHFTEKGGLFRPKLNVKY